MKLALPVMGKAMSASPLPRGERGMYSLHGHDHNLFAKTDHGFTTTMHITRECPVIQHDGKVCGIRDAWGGPCLLSCPRTTGRGGSGSAETEHDVLRKSHPRGVGCRGMRSRGEVETFKD